MSNEDIGGVYVENCGHRYRVMVLRDFMRFRDFCKSEAEWSEKYKSKTGDIKVDTRPPDPIPGEKGSSSLNVCRVRVEMPKVPPRSLYDALHDPVYRKTWDDKMLKGYNICQLNPHNDIGYYAGKFPYPLANRDFCNMRSWMEFSNNEYIIFNHSEPHPECPELKDFVRAKSYLTGYYIMPEENGDGCVMIYLTHLDPCGSIPHWLINKAMTSQVPNTMSQLRERGEKYVSWAAAEYSAGHIHEWTTPKMDWNSKNDYPKPKMPEELTQAIIAQAESSVTGPPREVEAGADASTAEGSVRRTGSLFTYAATGDAAPAATAAGGAATAPDGAPRTAADAAVMQQMAAQIESLQREVFLQRTSANSGMSLAPVAPGNAKDTADIQRFRAIMQDAANYVDRQFVEEGHVPTVREYLVRLHCLLEGMRRTGTV